MRKLVVKGFILVALVLAISAFIRLWIIDLPPGWGEPRTARKWEQILESKPNTFFVGSSRVYNHFDPAEIDPVLSELGVRSYNLGLPASQLGWARYQIRELLARNDQLQIKAIFVELSSFERLSERQMPHLRFRYWMDHVDLADAVVGNYQAHGVKTAVSALLHNGSAYTAKLLNVDLLGSQFDRRMNSAEFQAGLREWNVAGCGFYSPESVVDGRTVKSYQELRDDPSLLEEVVVAAQRQSDLDPLSYPRLLERCLALIAQAEKKGVRLVFMRTPRSKVLTDYADLYNALPEGNRMDLDLYELYPELYTIRYSFDKGHLNKEGTVIFSRKFAELARDYLD